MVSRPGSWKRARAGGPAVLAVLVVLTILLPTSPSAFTGKTLNTGSGFGAATSFYAEAVRADGAAGYWRLGEAAGSAVVADSSGNGHPGSYRNSPTLGVAGTSHDNDTAQKAGSATWGVLPRLVVDDYSVELWFKSTASDPFVATNWFDAPYMMIGNIHYNSNAGHLGIGLNGDGTILAGTSQTNTTIATTTGYNDGNWHHVVFTRVKSTGTIKLYVDSVLKNSATGAGTGTEDDSPDIGLGGNYYKDFEQWHMFDGYLDEVAQYTAALSSTRITAHYSARNSGYTAAVTADSPAGYWRLNEPTGVGRLAATIGGAGNAGGIGADVLHGQPGATGDGDTAMQFPRKPPRYAYVPRLISTTFTLEAGFRTTQDLGASGTWYGGNDIVGGEQSGIMNDFGFSIGADGRLYAGTGNPDTTVASTATYNDGSWHTIAMTRNGGTGAIKLYADGVQVGSGTGGTQALTAPPVLQLGSHYWNTNSYETFNGDISDVAQYTTVLTQTRLAAHVSAATSAPAYRSAVQADSPVGYWPLNDTTARR
jgi:large repetitive protein